MSSTISVVRAWVFKDVSVLAWDVGCVFIYKTSTEMKRVIFASLVVSDCDIEVLQ